MSHSVPQYVCPADWTVREIRLSDPDLPLIRRVGTYVTDQGVLDDIEATAIADGVPLVFLKTPPMGFTQDARLANTDAFYPTPALLAEMIGTIPGETGPPGPTTIAVGTVTTADPGMPADVTNAGTAEDVVLDFTIPRGDEGPEGSAGVANELTIGTVTTADSGEDADAAITGTAPAQVLDLTLPRGVAGDTGQPGVPGPFGAQIVATVGSGTYTMNPVGGTDYTLTLTGNITLAAVNMTPRQSLVVYLVQDANGSRAVTLPSTWTGASSITLSTDPNTADVLVVWTAPLLGTFVKHVFSGPLSEEAWSPHALSNQHDWFTADSVAQEDGTEVLAWDNNYDAGADMTAPGGAGTGPVLRSLYGKKYLEFDGANDYLASAFSSISPPFTIGMVVRVNETTGKTPVLNGPNLGNTEVFVDGTGPKTWRVNGSGATQNNGADFETVVVHVINNTTGYVRVNGTETSGKNTGGAALVGLRVGRAEAASSNYGQIDVSDILLLTKTPAGTDVADIENFLNPQRDQLNGVA